MQRNASRIFAISKSRITLHPEKNSLYAPQLNARVARLALDDPVQFGMGLAVARVAQDQNRT